MADPGFARPLSAIDCEIRSTLTLQTEAGQQLDTIRRQIAGPQDHRTRITAEVEARREKINLLLDERLWAVQVDALVTP